MADTAVVVSVRYGDVPKWLKGPHSKCGRSAYRRKGSNPFISVSYMDKEKHRDEESTQMVTVTEKFRWLRGMQKSLWKMASERRTEPDVWKQENGKAATGSACYSGRV